MVKRSELNYGSKMNFELPLRTQIIIIVVNSSMD